MLIHTGDTEIGAFGIAAEKNLLYVVDLALPKQQTSCVSVEFHDDAVADHFDRCVDRGLAPQQFARLWIHSHPGDSAEPSWTDEKTFDRVFGSCDWAVMAIFARGGESYARLAFNTGPGGSLLIPIRVDWAAWPKAVAVDGSSLPDMLAHWQQEYQQNVIARVLSEALPLGSSPDPTTFSDDPWLELAMWEDLDRIDSMAGLSLQEDLHDPRA